ncbi:hypothetical protein CC1G_15737 [Coprinopsis cinerea okayama7|uniref:BHLH domain-containing protein n=1 Tax=Coprinopsis cinerea (strain Okayama-7 / 130 / ATCC MYA-4618 / FGSC 9003) TaxID=240176 RepID=D6RQ96_COPC7|nr:hypothetical protein CC1G_15737 [Coprinopsis cinerea okayama7\|eukprot:XP_002910308.1 hypothetical protein CC1G_15737 [Coprinopsis cinerea okayama7\
MSYYTGTTPASAYKPQAQVRVEGFHMPSPGTPPGSSGTNNSAGSNNGANTTNSGGSLNDLFPHSFLPDAFRKFPPPAGSGEGSHDFNDDLVSLIGDRNGGPAGAGGGGGSGGGGGNTGASAGGGSGGAYEEGYHRPHNIFDVSSPIPVNSNHPNGAHNGPGSQPSSLHSPSTSLHDYQHHPPPHFNSTLPALNSSMRYEPPPENNPLTPSSPNVPPSSYHVPHNGFTRHTPSPSHSHPGSIPIDGRSRSRSRPPSSGAAGPGSATSAAMNALNSGGVGPARTTRPRRGSSISGTSPPPLHGRPHAIVIPGGSRPSHSNVVGSPINGSAGPGSNPWFMANGQTQYSTDYLPTPDPSSQSGYGHFSLSPPPQSSTNTGSDLSHHLPPLHHMAHSLPKSPMEQHVPHPTHQHHLSGSGMPKSPLDHPYPSSYGFGSGNVNGTGGGSPPGASPGSLPNGMGSGLGNGSMGAGGVTPTPSSYGMSNMGMNMNMAGLPGSAPSGGIQPPQAIISGGTPASTAALSASDKQALLANEKRRRRRESHNAVERRRRDNINEKISELATLIPECMLEGAGPPNAKDTGVSITPPLTEDALVPKPKEEPLKQEKDEDGTIPPSGTQEGGTVVKANKGMILRKSVEYIRYLQQLVTAQGARNRELEQELRKFRGSSVSSDSPSSNSGEGGANPGTDFASMFRIREVLTLDDEDDADGDDSMSLGMGGEEMVLHDEIVGSPTLTAATATAAATTTTTAANGGATGAPAAPPARKGHHKHSSSTSRPKPPRLPSMPEEDMEVDKMSNAGDVANDGESLSPGSSTNEGGNSGDAEDQERGRTRGVRGVHGQGGGAQGQQGQGMGTGVNGSMKEEMLDEGGDHSMGAMDNMFGMMNGHHGHHQMNHHQQQVMGW